jgi:hypothetical protein
MSPVLSVISIVVESFIDLQLELVCLDSFLTTNSCCLSVCLSVWLAVCLCMSVSLPICLGVCLSVCLSIRLSDCHLFTLLYVCLST